MGNLVGEMAKEIHRTKSQLIECEVKNIQKNRTSFKKLFKQVNP
jgi:hypothetical protein